MIGLLLLLAATPASTGPARVDPGLEPEDVEDQYRAFATGKGRAGDAAELVCGPFAEGLRLCFSHPVGKKRVYYTRADGKSLADLVDAGVGTDEEAVARLEEVKVEGFTRSYWLSAKGDGRDHLPALHPEALRRKLGGDPSIAVPARGVLVAWVHGDPEFDKVVAVGALKMHETMPDAVSPLVYRWDGKTWVAWARAKEAGATP
ncbi:MAG: hypothetical protein ACOZNI_26640 [Myxococcota bacterium]